MKACNYTCSVIPSVNERYKVGVFCRRVNYVSVVPAQKWYQAQAPSKRFPWEQKCKFRSYTNENSWIHGRICSKDIAPYDMSSLRNTRGVLNEYWSTTRNNLRTLSWSHLVFEYLGTHLYNYCLENQGNNDRFDYFGDSEEPYGWLTYNNLSNWSSHIIQHKGDEQVLPRLELSSS